MSPPILAAMFDPRWRIRRETLPDGSATRASCPRRDANGPHSADGRLHFVRRFLLAPWTLPDFLPQCETTCPWLIPVANRSR